MALIPKDEPCVSGHDPDGRGRDTATHAARSPWGEANFERDPTGLTVTRARIPDTASPRTHAPQADDGLAFRRPYKGVC